MKADDTIVTGSMRSNQICKAEDTIITGPVRMDQIHKAEDTIRADLVMEVESAKPTIRPSPTWS